MDRQRAIKILEALAYGNDPVTGQRIEAAGFNMADTARALFAAVAALRRADIRHSTATLSASGTFWTKREEARLCHEFDRGLSLAQIAIHLGRTTAAVKRRLIKLGRINDSVEETKRVA